MGKHKPGATLEVLVRRPVGRRSQELTQVPADPFKLDAWHRHGTL
jgi:hypothetical protein